MEMCIRDRLEFVLLDLIRLSENKKVLCDCHLTVAQALAFSEPARVVFLIKDPSKDVYKRQIMQRIKGISCT